jgi:hypothetical protein
MNNALLWYTFQFMQSSILYYKIKYTNYTFFSQLKKSTPSLYFKKEYICIPSKHVEKTRLKEKLYHN